MNRTNINEKLDFWSRLALYGLLFSGLLAVTFGCGNFVAGGDINVGVQAFRDYMPEVTQEVEIGKWVEVDNLAVSVVGVRVTDGRDDKLRPRAVQEGEVYLLVNVLLANQGDKREDISSRMSFSLFDSMGQTQEWAYYPAAAGSIDGRIDPGRERMGELTWKVAENAEGLMLVFGDVAFSLGEASGYSPGSPG